MELEEAAGHAKPALQNPVQEELDSPARDPYSPAAQSEHDPAAPKLYLPAGHVVAVELVELAGQAYPGEHAPSQLEFVCPGVAPYLPAAQEPLQAADASPGEAPNRPAEQVVQVEDPAPLYFPAGHWRAVEVVDPAAHA